MKINLLLSLHCGTGLVVRGTLVHCSSEGNIGGWKIEEEKLSSGTDLVLESSQPKIYLGNKEIVRNGGNGFNSNQDIIEKLENIVENYNTSILFLS